MAYDVGSLVPDVDWG